jgi:hypothetical protein
MQLVQQQNSHTAAEDEDHSILETLAEDMVQNQVDGLVREDQEEDPAEDLVDVQKEGRVAGSVTDQVDNLTEEILAEDQKDAQMEDRVDNLTESLAKDLVKEDLREEVKEVQENGQVKENSAKENSNTKNPEASLGGSSHSQHLLSRLPPFQQHFLFSVHTHPLSNHLFTPIVTLTRMYVSNIPKLLDNSKVLDIS